MILGEIGGNTVLLQVAHSPMPERVHTADRDSDSAAQRFQHLSDNVVSLKRSAVSGFKDPASGSISQMILEHLNRSRVNENIAVSLAGLRSHFLPTPHRTSNSNQSAIQV